MLKKNLIRDNKGLCDLFTKDFGKVTVWITESKLKTPIDIGGIIQAQIKVEGKKNTLQSYKIKRPIQYSALEYEQIKNILSVITLIFKTMPEGVSNSTIFEDYLASLPSFESREENRLAICLFELKITKYLGIAESLDEHSETLQKTFQIIDRIKLVELVKEKRMLAYLDEMQAYTTKCLGKYLI